MTVAWGILSTARINLRVLAGARESDRAEVIAVASRDPGRADAYAREHGIERAYGGYDALLEDPDVEAVYISLPNSMHVAWTLRALEAGKHVLCEKPFSRRPEEVEQAFDVAESAGLVLSEAFMWRHHPQTAKLAELVAGGAIGRLRLVRAVFSFQVGVVHAEENVRLDPDLDGGSLMDVGCYCVNAIRFLAGEPERVQGEQVVGKSGVDVCFTGALRLSDEVLAHFDSGLVLPHRGEIEVVGEDASLHVEDPWHVRSPGIDLRGEEGVERIAIAPSNSYRLELENVGDAIRGTAPLLLGRNDAVGQARTLDALYRSAEVAGPVPAVARSTR